MREHIPFSRVAKATTSAFHEFALVSSTLSRRVDNLPFREAADTNRGFVDTDIWAQTIISGYFRSCLRYCFLSKYFWMEFEEISKLDQENRDCDEFDVIAFLLHGYRELFIIDLYNFYAAMKDQFGEAIKLEFDSVFPNLVDARDTIAHPHDRDFARARRQPIPNADENFLMSGGGDWHQFIDQKGKKWVLRFDLQKLEDLVSRLQLRCSQ